MHGVTRLRPDSARHSHHNGSTQRGPEEELVSATEVSRGVFDRTSKLFSRFRARMVFRDKLIGGVPKDPRLIEGWLRARAGLEDVQEIRQAMLRTLGELGVDVHEDMTFEQLEQASAALAARKQTTGFKLGEHGLYVEGPADQSHAQRKHER